MSNTVFSAIGIVVFIVIVIIVIIVIIIYEWSPQSGVNNSDHLVPVVEGNMTVVGLDEATIETYPKLPYYEAKLKYKGTSADCCSICLANYGNDDLIRLLPECKHLFHHKCVKPWLLQQATCPVCRKSPLKSASMPTQQIEEVILTAPDG